MFHSVWYEAEEMIMQTLLALALILTYPATPHELLTMNKSPATTIINSEDSVVERGSAF